MLRAAFERGLGCHQDSTNRGLCFTDHDDVSEWALDLVWVSSKEVHDPRVKGLEHESQH